MEFRTQVPFRTYEPRIDYQSRILLLGSCFVENIGRKFEYFKFQHLQNPFGILFHPLAIEKFLQRVSTGYTYSEDDIFFHNERWHSFEAHSVLSDPDKEKLVEQLNENLKRTRQFLHEASHVIITPGTAWGYEHLEERITVANCHKLPQKNFKKNLLSIMGIQQSLENSLAHIASLNADLSVIFTVSPVRHIRDGFVENQRSKAHLIAALHQLLEEKSEVPGLFYFPSYEIMMDELRDYRFYADDMLHPGAIAIDYIWKRFREVCIAPESYPILKEVSGIRKALAHKPFNKNSKAYLDFKEKLGKKINKLQLEFSHISF